MGAFKTLALVSIENALKGSTMPYIPTMAAIMAIIQDAYLDADFNAIDDRHAVLYFNSPYPGDESTTIHIEIAGRDEKRNAIACHIHSLESDDELEFYLKSQIENCFRDRFDKIVIHLNKES